MTFEEYQIALQGVIDDLEGGVHAELMVSLANGAIFSIKRRIQESGINAKGGRYKDYTQEYKEYKTSKGKYKGFTDFAFTNRMWTSVQLVSTQPELFSGVARITATGTDTEGVSNRKKLEGNVNMFGQILDLSEQEKRDLLTDYDNGILQIFRNHGL